jgi:hypothetical protein
MAEEQWLRAIDELRTAVADSGEPRRDEALYWLAHSLNQSGDPAAAVETVSRLERDFPSSIWVKPGQSLRLEIAVRLRRSDVLWWTALHPSAPTVVRARRPVPKAGGRDGSPSRQPPVAAPTPPAPDVKAPPPPPAPPPKIWYSDSISPDTDLRIQALGGLIKTDGEKVIPILRDIVLESQHPAQANRALFLLAQSDLPGARAAVVEVAKTGPIQVRVAAVREFARFGGPEMSGELMQVYPHANKPVRMQIAKSLGERAEKSALLRIVQIETDGQVRYFAFLGLGRAGEVGQLAGMYKSADVEGKRSIIGGLFYARAEGELIRIAEAERRGGNDQLWGDACERLRLLGTPKAKDYLLKVSEKR